MKNQSFLWYVIVLGIPVTTKNESTHISQKVANNGWPPMSELKYKSPDSFIQTVNFN